MRRFGRLSLYISIAMGLRKRPALLINIKSDGTPEISQLRYFSWGHPGGCLVGSLDGFEVIETGEANDSRDM
jgi:hypothetical protein